MEATSFRDIYREFEGPMSLTVRSLIALLVSRTLSQLLISELISCILKMGPVIKLLLVSNLRLEMC